MAALTVYEVPTWSQIYDMLLNQAAKIRSDGYIPDHRWHRPGRFGALTNFGRSFGDAGFRYNHHRILRWHRPKSAGTHPKTVSPYQLTTKKFLLVDDVSDGGKSLQLAKKHLQDQCAKEIKIATIYCKPGTVTTPDYFEKETSHWIVFPWEARETMIKSGAKSVANALYSREITNLVRSGYPKQLAEKVLQNDGTVSK